MRYAQSVADLVGDTPLVQLTRVTDGIAATVLAKVEYFNPGGSAKDRIARRIIDAAERDGLLKPGGTLVSVTTTSAPYARRTSTLGPANLSGTTKIMR